MGTVLVERWLQGAAALPMLDEASVAAAREQVRALGRQLGIGEPIIEALSIVASELGHNQLRHGRGGKLALRPLEREGVAGIEIVAADRGAGIADPELAFQGSGGSARGLGIGLAGVRGLADELDVDIRLGEGTCLWARKFATQVPRRREVAIFGRACPGETVSGDQAGFVRSPDRLHVALVDGLGHGPLAQEASLLAIDVFGARAPSGPSPVLRECDTALKATRGGVMSVVTIDESGRELEYASVGNVGAGLWQPRANRRFGPSSGVLGKAGPGLARILTERAAIEPMNVLVMWSDGLTSQLTLDEDPALQRRPPILIAQHLLGRFARPDDDALVLVAR